ncbi:cysteine-rich CWC family protein [Pseudomonas sp. JM0905a]|uniref:Cysteine-rich CWC family protein n=1 Tax=Metapseudomonas resinovorans TaxID=53412 RepID=A0ABT4Y2N0_METRE|nr:MULTISPECIES: cysteine-rich CWC family protein [Pseudomonas]MBD2836270.1 cysteine-rich CWC family protein [Pseudomonas sp. JM0905a]MDA8482875.1 cysteine-rich CWC family protein [Pseudomonas resinovorans]
MSAPSDPTRCPLCGQSNQCTQADPTRAGQACWCFTAKIDPAALERIPAQEIDRACLCPHCAQALPPDAPS